MSVTRVLVANRGEIAVRIIRACQSLGIETVAAVSEADRESLAAKMANRAVCIGPPRSVDSYLKTGTLVAAAQSTGCDALHPGYGFLSERAELAQACADNKITFIGPSAENITNMGDKLEARKIAASCGVSTVPGSDHAKNPREAAAQAEKIGYPVLLKASAGGGGRESSWFGIPARCPPPSAPPPQKPGRRSATTRFTWNDTSATPGILRSRSWATYPAMSSIWASVTVRCNGAIKKSSRNSRLRRV